MPGLNGYQTCVEMRKLTNAPILFLSARTQESDKTLGFSSGGDDYLAKPFFLRRTGEPRQGTDPQIPGFIRKTRPARHSIPKSPIISLHWMNAQGSYQIWCPCGTDRHGIFHSASAADASGTDFPTEHLYESIWNEPYYYGANNVIMVHIRNLRRKIEDDPKNPTLIKTVWGRGYRCDKRKLSSKRNVPTQII